MFHYFLCILILYALVFGLFCKGFRDSERMVYPWGTKRLPPSTKRMDAEPTLKTSVNGDAKAFQKMLQQIDESFHVRDDDGNEQRQRMQKMEERQLTLQRLCEEVLLQEEGANDLRRYETGRNLWRGGRVESGIVSTPRSIESLSMYDEVLAAATRSGSLNNKPAAPLMAPPPLPSSFAGNMDPFFTETGTPGWDYGGRTSTHLRPPAPTTATATVHTTRSRPLASPAPPLPPPPSRPPPPPLSPIDVATQKKGHCSLDSLPGTTRRVESGHPYAMDREKKWQRPHPHTVPVVSGLTFGVVSSDGISTLAAAPSSGVALEESLPEENFDTKWEEHLLRWMQLQTRGRNPSHDNRSAASPPSCNGATADSVEPNVEGENLLHKQGGVTPVFSSSSMIHPKGRDTIDYGQRVPGSRSGGAAYGGEKAEHENSRGRENAEGEGIKMPTSDISEQQMLSRENHALHEELEAQDKSMNELTQKMESLARHLVKSMRDRTQLKHRVEHLEELLDGANTEVGRLKKASEMQSEETCAAIGWRAALHAKEREVRICEEEILRLRSVIEKHGILSWKGPSQQDCTVTHAQLCIDYEDVLRELGVAYARRREAETHAECMSAELEAAQAHIQSLDGRLAEAERAAVVQRLREMQGCLLPCNALPLPPPSSSSSPPIPSAAEVATWPKSAQLEVGRLVSLAESLVVQPAQCDLHAETRLSQLCRENTDLRDRCRACEAEMRGLESEVEALRLERARSKLSEETLYEKLANVQKNAALLSDILQVGKRNAEEVLTCLEESSSDCEPMKAAVNAFVKSALRDSDAVLRFFAALQEIDFVDMQRQREIKVHSVSSAAKIRKDLLMQAIEAVMPRPTSLPPPPPPQQQQQQQQHPDLEQAQVRVVPSEPLCRSSIEHHASIAHKMEAVRREEEEEEDTLKRSMPLQPPRPSSSSHLPSLPPPSLTPSRVPVLQDENTTARNNPTDTDATAAAISTSANYAHLCHTVEQERKSSNEKMHLPTHATEVSQRPTSGHQGELRIPPPSQAQHVSGTKTHASPETGQPDPSCQPPSSASREARLLSSVPKAVYDKYKNPTMTGPTKSLADSMPLAIPRTGGNVEAAGSMHARREESSRFPSKFVSSSHEELAPEEKPPKRGDELDPNLDVIASLPPDLDKKENDDGADDAEGGEPRLRVGQTKHHLQKEASESQGEKQSVPSAANKLLTRIKGTRAEVVTSAAARASLRTSNSAARAINISKTRSSDKSGSTTGGVQNVAINDRKDELKLRMVETGSSSQREEQEQRKEVRKEEEEEEKIQSPQNVHSRKTATSSTTHIASFGSSELAAKISAPESVSSMEQGVPESTVREPKQRAVVAMEFPSLRHPTLGSGRRVAGEATASQATTTPPGAS